MSFCDLIRHIPDPWDTSQAAEISAALPDLPRPLRELAAGAGGCAPYLADLVGREQAWLSVLADHSPEQAFAAVLADWPTSPEPLAPALRQAKRRVALLTALADLGGVWSLDQVTGALSRFAAAATEAGAAACLRAALSQGGLPGFGPGTEPAETGYVILAMGKLGAAELNYSSDIDLIVLFDDSRYDPDDVPRARKALVRVTQALVKLLSAQDDGYVFRTDLRLRPNPSVTPVCLSMSAAEHYYETLGRTWERAAMIKARPIAGDIAAGEAFLTRLAPFIWRRNLDFAAIRDAEDMVLKIREHKGLSGPITFDDHDIKLGRGGIREIEFFAQTHQLIFGGRDARLRRVSTVAALAALAEAGRIEAAQADSLSEAYVAHRGLEHRIQMLDDAQTHMIPASEDKRGRLARLSGLPDARALAADVVARLTRVHGLTGLRGKAQDAAPHLDGAAEASAFLQREADWRALPVMRSERARELFAALRDGIATRIAESGAPEAALAQFEAFLAAQPAGVQLFSLFAANPTLLDLIIDICATAPAAAEHLARNTSVLDAVLDADFFEALPDQAMLAAQLEASLGSAQDFEAGLNALRRWQKDMNFRIDVQLLRGLIGPDQAGHAYSDIAQSCVAAALPLVVAHLRARFGAPPGAGMAVVAMGKLGSREMTASSDLDLIVIYDAPTGEMTRGKKEVAASTYYARATQALINALTAPTAEGTLYEVDMRLRPSGNQGPVATALAGFVPYQHEKAWTWEHLALTRARVIAGPPELTGRVAAALQDAGQVDRVAEDVLRDVADMRRRLEQARGDAGPWDVKQGPGGMMDIELLAQTGLLLSGFQTATSGADALQVLQSRAFLPEADMSVLSRAHTRMRAVQHVARLVGHGFDPDAHAGQAMLLQRATGWDSPAVARAEISALRAQSAAIVDRVLTAG